MKPGITRLVALVLVVVFAEAPACAGDDLAGLWKAKKWFGPAAASGRRTWPAGRCHLLTMSGGFFCDDSNDDAPGNEDKMWDQTEEPDFYRYTMAVPMATPPGENAVYCSAMPNLALSMVGRAAHENPMVLFERLIAQPMKIRHYAWSVDPAGHPYGGGGMNLRLRDFAKLGQLMLNGGAWNGHRIVSREFAARASSPLYHLRKLEYGYLWWIEDYPYKGRTVRVFSARGSGGQTVTVVPALDLVVGTFGGSYSSLKGMSGGSVVPIPRIILPPCASRATTGTRRSSNGSTSVRTAGRPMGAG